MKIKSIKTVENGNGGLKVEHVISRSDNTYDVFRNDKYTHPIGEELDRNLKKLKVHLLKLCRVWKNSWDLYVDFDRDEIFLCDDDHEAKATYEDLVVTGVTSNYEHFVIIGKTKSVDNTNVNYITGCIHSETEYKYYDHVINTIRDIYSSVETYVASDPVMKPEPSKNQIDMQFETQNEELKEVEEVKI